MFQHQMLFNNYSTSDRFYSFAGYLHCKCLGLEDQSGMEDMPQKDPKDHLLKRYL